MQFFKYIYLRISKKSSNFARKIAKERKQATQNNTHMKKYLSICLMAIIACMAGCTYPTYKTYEVVEDCQFNKKTIELIVTEDKWDFDESTGQFFCHFNVPELTEKVYTSGEVSINREYNSGTKNAYQVALPETSYKVENEYDETTGEVVNTFYYQQHVDYAFGVNFVEVFYTISDYFYPSNWTPEGMRFRLQLTY